MPMDASQGIVEATNLLRGTGDQQLKNKQLDQEQASSSLNFLKDASGKAIDFMTQASQDKTILMAEQMKLEAEAECQKVEIAAKQTDESRKLDLDKAKHDYENFVTITPEIAQGLFSSTKGKIDFRRSVGQRIMTRVLVPLIQISGREVAAESKGGGKPGSKDLNALKAFTAQYDKKKKASEDPLRVSMASRSPQAKASLDADLKWLQANEGKYNQATSKIGEMGGLEDEPQGDDTVTPPATSSSDIDALIDSAFK